MRVMEIPRFSRQIEILDLENFVRTRLSQTVVMWPDQAVPLLGYMCHPNDPEARDVFVRMLWRWPEGSEAAPPAIPEKLNRIQHEWLRVADVFHHVCDLAGGQHQARRGGPSVGKAITLVAANAKSWGIKAANLWKIWRTYKDVAHLVTAAALICAEVDILCRKRPFGPSGLSGKEINPFQMAMLMPDFVLAVALEFERHGLGIVPHARTEPTLASETLWRIPSDINVVPLPPPIRKIRPQDLAILNNRRAGKRGKGNLRKTTPVSG